MSPSAPGAIRTRAEDAALVREVAAGSETALAELYDRHGSLIYRGALALSRDRGVAEEVVQETFLALWNRAETFDPRLGSLTSWLLAIVRNRSIDRIRASARRVPRSPSRRSSATSRTSRPRRTGSSRPARCSSPGPRSRPRTTWSLHASAGRWLQPRSPGSTNRSGSRSSSRTATVFRNPKSPTGSAGHLARSRLARDVPSTGCGASWTTKLRARCRDPIRPRPP